MRQHLVPWLRYKCVQQIHSSTKWRLLLGLSIFSETEYFLPPLLVNSVNSVVVFMNILAWGLGSGSCFPAFPERKAQRALPDSTVGVLSASWMVQCRPMSRLITKAPTRQNKYLTSYRKGTKPNRMSEENNASVVTRSLHEDDGIPGPWVPICKGNIKHLKAGPGLNTLVWKGNVFC